MALLYALVLFTHSLLRWLVLASIVLVCVRSFLAWRQQRAWGALDERLHVLLMGVVDAQFLLGLVLYVLLSPFPWAFWVNLATAMKDPILRFYGMEHMIGMVAGIVVLHVGRDRSKQAATDALRHRRVWTGTLTALAIILIAIPWPDRLYGRPLFRPLW